MLSNDIRQAIQDIISQNRIDRDPSYTFDGFQTIDLFPIFHHLYSPAAYKVMITKADGLLVQRNEFNHHYPLVYLLNRLNISPAEKLVANDLIGPFNRVLDKVLFFGSTVTLEQVPMAVEKLITTMNYLASKGYITATLAPLSCIKFQEVDKSAPAKYAVISYVAATMIGESYVQQNMAKLTLREGSIPNSIEDQ